MRNYWVKIALGALGIFAIGMVLISIVRSGIDRVHTVVEGSGPISIPLKIIPFTLAGDRLGRLERLKLHRTQPNVVSRVELEIELKDSLMALGLEGCRLAADFEDDSPTGEVATRRRSFSEGTFWCVGKEDSANSDLVEYGEARFRPGDVVVPLLLTQGLVEELRDFDLGGNASEHAESVAEAEAESVAAEAERAAAEAQRRQVRNHLVDSLRAEGRRRADSALEVLRSAADTLRPR
jgi:hypothetical protein